MNNSQVKTPNQNNLMNSNSNFMGMGNSNRGPTQPNQTSVNFGMNQMNLFGQNVIKISYIIYMFAKNLKY